MRIILLNFVIALAYAVDMPFFFDATRAPEIFRDQLGMREAMDVWGQMIRKMTNGEKPDNVRQQVLRPKKVDKSVLKTLPKARGEIINERLLNMLLPRVRQETMATMETSPTPSSTQASTTSSTTTTIAPTTTTTTAAPTTAAVTTKLSTTVSTTAFPTTTEATTSSLADEGTTVEKMTSIDRIPEHTEKDGELVTEIKGEAAGSAHKQTENLMKNPKLSVRIHTANETREDTMDSAVMSILMEKIGHKKNSIERNGTDTVTAQKNTSLVPEYTEEIRSRNVLKEKNLESEELFKDHEANSLLLHGSELLENANSSTIADIKQLIEKIEQEVTNGTETVQSVPSTSATNEKKTEKKENDDSSKKNKSEKGKVEEDKTEVETTQTTITKEMSSTSENRSSKENENTVTPSNKTKEQEEASTKEKTETEDEEEQEAEEEKEMEDEKTEEKKEEAEKEDEDVNEEVTEVPEETTQDGVDFTDKKVDESGESSKKPTDNKQNRIPEAEDDSEDSPAFVQSDDVNDQIETTTTRRNLDGSTSSTGTVFNIEANANSDSRPVQTSVITPITGILDTIRPLMYYFTRPMQAAGVRSFEPESDPNYYGYQKVQSPQQLTLSDLTANIAKRLLSSGSTQSDKSRWNPASIQDLQKNILQNYGSNTENQLVPLETIAKSSSELPKKPQVLTVEGSSQKVETEYYAPILPQEKNTLPIIARPSRKNKKKTVTTTTTTTTEAAPMMEDSEETTDEIETFDDTAKSAVETNFLGDSGVLLGKMTVPEPEMKESIPFALHAATDEAAFPLTYKTFGGGSFGGGRRPSIPLTEDSNSSSDILSFFDSKQR